MKAGVQTSSPRTAAPRLPSSFYRAGAWKLGRFFSRVLPEPHVERLARHAGAWYGTLAPRRRQVVVQNLLPVVNGDEARAEQACRSLFRHFGQKLIDLWRYERGGS